MMSAAGDHLIALGVECRRASDGTWSYVSVAPWPQLSSDGRPMLSVLTAGDIAFVSLTAQLDPPGAALEQVRAILAEGRQPATVTLTSGVRRVRAAEVSIGPRGATRVVATSPTSGFPPFTAAFAMQPSAEERAEFEAAMRGEDGHVRITYHAETDEGQARIEADLADWVRIH